jgi:hypothetical protein
VLYHLSHAPSLFFFFFALVIFQVESVVFVRGPASGYDPPTYALHVAGIIDTNHHTWLVLLR